MTSSTPAGDSEICGLSVAELGSLFRSGALSPVDATRAALNRVERLNPGLNAYLTVLPESALAAARAAELQLRHGIDLGPLHGIPFSVKDIIDVAGTRTTAASRVLLDSPVAEHDAPVVRSLRAAGAVLIGKTNLHEFAYGSPDPEGPFGPVQNARRAGHQAGSSSSGSAAAVAAGLGVFSLGTDTGGSVRHPASVCGVVGLKPTYGLVSPRGVVPLSFSLDHVGPLGRSVADVAACLAAIAGHDPADPNSAPRVPVDYLGALDREPRGLRLGIPTNAFYQFGLPEAKEVLEQARRALENLGLVAVPLELPRAEETNDLSTLIISVELWAYHQQYRDREELYGRDFKKRAAGGLAVSGLEYARAMEARAEIRRAWMDLFEQVDVILMPANVVGAPPHGVETVEIGGEQHPVRMATSRFSRASNITGMPALVVPAGEIDGGLPIGVQFVGPHFGEARLLAVGHALERAIGEPVRRWGIDPRPSSTH